MRFKVGDKTDAVNIAGKYRREKKICCNLSHGGRKRSFWCSIKWNPRIQVLSLPNQCSSIGLRSFSKLEQFCTYDNINYRED